MGAQVPLLSPNDHPNPSWVQPNGFMKNGIFKKLSRATKQPIQCENNKSSLARGHMGGGDWGYLELGPGTPAMG